MLRRSRKAVRIWVLHKSLGHSDTTVTKFPQILSHHTQNSDSGSVEKSSAWAWWTGTGRTGTSPSKDSASQ